MQILTYIETRQGKVRSVGLEALSCARKLADKAGGKLTALIIAPNSAELAQEVAPYGPDLILTVNSDDLATYTPEGYREAILAAAMQANANVIVMSATIMGRDLAPAVAARLEAGILPDCISVEYDEGKITATRPVYAGRCIMTLAAVMYPVVISLRPKAFLATVRNGSHCNTQSLEVDLNGKICAVPVETKFESSGQMEVTEADVIVAGGRGMKEAENFKLIEELAVALNGAVGASRAVVDSGWRSHGEQIGQTGKVVNPTLYIAAGISGAIQHLAGMRTSKVIVAINKDPDAPIFKVADYGIVGDAMEILPILTDKIKAMN